jgi:hypothetical protein
MRKKLLTKTSSKFFFSLRPNKDIVLILRDTFVSTDLSKLPSFLCDDSTISNEFNDGCKQRNRLWFRQGVLKKDRTFK